MKTTSLVCLVLVMTILGAIASYFLKRASDKGTFIAMLQDKYIYFGGSFYIVAAFLNVCVLRYLDYSIVLPLTSITYIWTLLIARWLLNEEVTKTKVTGILCIMCGVSILLV